MVGFPAAFEDPLSCAVASTEAQRLYYDDDAAAKCQCHRGIAQRLLRLRCSVSSRRVTFQIDGGMEKTSSGVPYGHEMEMSTMRCQIHVVAQLFVSRSDCRA